MLLCKAKSPRRRGSHGTSKSSWKQSKSRHKESLPGVCPTLVHGISGSTIFPFNGHSSIHPNLGPRPLKAPTPKITSSSLLPQPAPSTCRTPGNRVKAWHAQRLPFSLCSRHFSSSPSPKHHHTPSSEAKFGFTEHQVRGHSFLIAISQPIGPHSPPESSVKEAFKRGCKFCLLPLPLPLPSTNTTIHSLQHPSPSISTPSDYHQQSQHHFLFHRAAAG